MSDEVFISKEGLEKLREELKYRKEILRKEISNAIGVAKDQGDLSENFEYQDAKERQGTNEVRISQIELMIENAVVVENKLGQNSISLGTKFLVLMPNGEKKNFEIVGSSETDPMCGKISNESPLGNLFLGHECNDEISVDAPSGKMIYKIISIQ